MKNKTAAIAEHHITKTALAWQMLVLVRPLEWSKNAFVLLPAIFSDIPKILQNSDLSINIILATTLFCTTASSVYVFNDIIDLQQDRMHPVKARARPLANKKLSIQTAWATFALLSVISFSFSWLLLPKVAIYLQGYWLLMLLYSYKFKHIPIFDLFVIAIGFCLRVYAGCAALNIEPSLWMLSTTLCLSLFLAASKRRQESIIQQGIGNNSPTRKVLNSYSVPLVERYMTIAAICTLMFYSLFATEVRAQLGLTIPFVLFGFFRYLLLLDLKPNKDSPTELLFSDKTLLVCVATWGAGTITLLWLL